MARLAPSSSGLGRQVLILEIAGSNPAGVTYVEFFLIKIVPNYNAKILVYYRIVNFNQQMSKECVHNSYCTSVVASVTTNPKEECQDWFEPDLLRSPSLYDVSIALQQICIEKGLTLLPHSESFVNCDNCPLKQFVNNTH